MTAATYPRQGLQNRIHTTHLKMQPAGSTFDTGQAGAVMLNAQNKRPCQAHRGAKVCEADFAYRAVASQANSLR